jgi:hypothetical protein
MAMDPDAVDEVESLAFDEGLLDRDALDHPPDLAFVVEGQLDPQAPVLHLREPPGLVVAAFLDLVRPFFKTETIGLFVFG